jgi:SAM-dependent methyltransferase
MPEQHPEATFALRPEVYDQLVNWPRRLEREGPFFRQIFEQHAAGRVLDLACGTGHHARLFASWGLTVCGVDGSAAMIAHCRRVHGESAALQWVAARMEALPAFDARFDAIVCLGNSLAMLPNEETVAAVLRAAAARLDAGGVIVLHVLNVGHLPDGPIVWQKARQVTAGGVTRFIVKGVHRAGPRAFVDVAEVPSDAVDDFTHCRSTPVLGVTAEMLRSAFAAAGLQNVTFYGDHARTAFDAAESPNLIAVAAA